MKINTEAFEKLKSSICDFKTWNGINAKDWGNYFYGKSLNKSLDCKLTRALLCVDFLKNLTNEEIAIAILSWGGMNREHGKSLFQHKEWFSIIERMKNNEIKTRKEAYELFSLAKKNKKLRGMGPAYFTKLICFISPNLKGYIMDQWSSKSINLLFENKTVFLNNNGCVNDKNTADIYEDFCLKIEYLAQLLNLKPIDLEENLFSNGGVYKGKWRQFVVDNWCINGKSKSIKKVKIIIDIDMEPITFKEVLTKLTSKEIEIPTLGGQKKLIIKRENNFINITNSKNKSLKVDQNLWGKVMDRMNELPQDERGMSSRYGDGKKQYNWKKCPNRVFAIYIPAIVKYLSK